MIMYRTEQEATVMSLRVRDCKEQVKNLAPHVFHRDHLNPSQYPFLFHKITDGSEVDNLFLHNLGAETMDLDANNGQSDSFENGSVTFWMRNIKNHWIGNVAAGAKGVGYWFDIPKKGFVLNPLYTFKDNAAHSSATGISMYPGRGLIVANKNTAVLDGMRIWNNHMVGLMMFFSGGYKVTNSIIVNNKIGIQDTFSALKAVQIKNTRVIGSLSNPSIDAGLQYTYNNQMWQGGQVRKIYCIIHLPYKKKLLYALTRTRLCPIHAFDFTGDSQARAQECYIFILRRG